MQVAPPEEMLSLYDFFGYKPAGSSLGYEVATHARNNNIPISYRYCAASPYVKPINLYPVSFLEKYFNQKRFINAKYAHTKQSRF